MTSGLQAIATDLWIADGPIVSFYGFPYPTRMVVVRLKSGDLWLWSPVAATAKLVDEVAALGPVRFLVSPNKIHHLFLAEWLSRFPEATVWGTAEAIRKLPQLPWQPPIDGGAPPAWRGEIDQQCFTGSKIMTELAFFHRRSRTLILADLIEAFTPEFMRAHLNWWQRLLARVARITERHHLAPIDYRLSFTGHRAQARAARDRMLGWDVKRVIMAHGRWIDEDAGNYLRESFAWLD